MPEITYKTVFDILLESLKIQAEKYKALIQADLTHEQRKEFDSEIKQMYDLLSNMTNSTIVLSSAEIETLKVQYELKIQELQTTLDNIDVTTVKGDTGEQGIQGIQGLKGDKGDKGDAGLQGIQGEKGDQGIQGLKGDTGSQGIQGEKGDQGIQGQNGIDGTHGLDGDDGLSAYQIALNNGFVGSELQWLESLKGDKGLSAYEIAVQDGYEGIESEWLESLLGQDGKDFTYDMFTLEQLELLKGADGQNGTNGLNGQDGAVTFESLTPEQIALLKGEKGDKGDTGLQGPQGLKGADGQNGTNGIDGQDGNSLTYNDLTTEQKQELANLIPVSGGGGSVSSNLLVLFANEFSNKAGTTDNIHYKTNIPISNVFKTKSYSCFLDKITNNYVSYRTTENFINSVVSPIVLGTITASGSGGSATTNRAYVSTDGFLCFQVSPQASTFPISNFNIEFNSDFE